MEMVQAQSQRGMMQMSGQMISSLAILGMSSSDLSEHLKEKAAGNPCIAYRPPAHFANQAEAFDQVAALTSDRPSLLAHVADQIELTFTSPADRMLALRFAEALEETGWLAQPVPAIAAQAGVPLARAEIVLQALHGLEPTGIFARSLSECLLLQAREADALTWELEMLIANLDLLAEGRTQELAEICDCEPEDIPEIARQLRAFDPKPGLAFAHKPAPVFPPDLIATRGPAGWQVELNRSTTPTITVLPDRLPDGAGDHEARAFRRAALAEAHALAQALAQRGDTLLRTGAVLVARQTAFLENGPGHLTPLSLEDVGQELELHSSTISRATSDRMIQTPSGTLPLRAFFSRAVPSGNGEAISRDAALSFVARIIKDEDPEQPLSDDAIVERASKDGLMIARRTVAKYRGALGIASSYKRRRTREVA
ncbi:MAG: RNA polymerase factor sigma-54 [Pseudomonadota bacterium]